MTEIVETERERVYRMSHDANYPTDFEWGRAIARTRSAVDTESVQLCVLRRTSVAAH